MPNGLSQLLNESNLRPGRRIHLRSDPLSAGITPRDSGERRYTPVIHDEMNLEESHRASLLDKSRRSSGNTPGPLGGRSFEDERAASRAYEQDWIDYCCGRRDKPRYWEY